jgi:hypothetical protein
MLDRINRTPTQYPNIGSGDLNPENAGSDRNLFDCGHSISFLEKKRCPNDKPILRAAAPRWIRRCPSRIEWKATVRSFIAPGSVDAGSCAKAQIDRAAKIGRGG